MIKQTDYFFKDGDIVNRTIYNYGCNFMCHIAIVYPRCTYEDVLHLYSACIANRTMLSNCTVKDPNGVAKTIASFYGVDSARQIGGKDSNSHYGIQFPDEMIDHIIHRHKTLTGLHFTASLCIKGENIYYDPYEARNGVYSINIVDNNIQQSYYAGGWING